MHVEDERHGDRDDALIIRTGDIRIRVLDKEFYCRYCDEYTRECFEKHRSGIWFKVSLNGAVFILGDGEREGRFPFSIDPGDLIYTNFACRYEHGYVTTGNWHSINVPLYLGVVDDDTWGGREVELNDDEKILLAKLVQDNIVKMIATVLKEEPDRLPLYLDWGIYNSLKPLFYVYIRDRQYYDLPFGAELNEEKNSFTAYFNFGNIRIRLPKVGKPSWGYWDWKGYAVLYAGSYEVYYAQVHDRKIAYLVSGDHILRGWEEYGGLIHDVEISDEDLPYSKPMLSYISIDLDKRLRLLFFRRLGDVFFIEEGGDTGALIPATQEMLRKIQIMNASLRRVDGDDEEEERLVLVPDGSGDIVLYHPDHGTLTLPPKRYVLYRVPAHGRGGHD